MLALSLNSKVRPHKNTSPIASTRLTECSLIHEGFFYIVDCFVFPRVFGMCRSHHTFLQHFGYGVGLRSLDTIFLIVKILYVFRHVFLLWSGLMNVT